MIANMNEKGRQTKLLAAVAILAMVVCVFAVAMPSDNVDGTTTASGAEGSIITYTIGDNTEVSVNAGELTNFLSAVNSATDDVAITIEKSFTVIPSGVPEYEAALWFNNPNDVTIIIDGGDNTITFAGTNETSVIGFYSGATYSVSDLTINGAYASGTNDSKHGINIVGADVTLSNITIMNNGAAGIVVNGGDDSTQSATVSASNITTSGNAWGGINVDSDDGAATFTLNGTDNSIGGTPQIWSEAGTVNFGEGLNFEAAEVNGMTWYTQTVAVSGESITSADISAALESSDIVQLPAETQVTSSLIPAIEAGKIVIIPETNEIEEGTEFSVDQGGAIVFAGTDNDTFSITGAGSTVVSLNGVTGNFTIAGGSIYINGTIAGDVDISGVTASDDADVYISGNITGDMNITGTGNVTLSNVIIDEGVSVTLGSGIGYVIAGNITLNGTMNVNGEVTTTSGTVTVASTGKLSVGTSGSLTGNVVSKPENIDAISDQIFSISGNGGNAVNGVTLTGDATGTYTGDVYIYKSGATGTITLNGTGEQHVYVRVNGSFDGNIISTRNDVTVDMDIQFNSGVRDNVNYTIDGSGNISVNDPSVNMLGTYMTGSDITVTGVTISGLSQGATQPTVTLNGAVVGTMTLNAILTVGANDAVITGTLTFAEGGKIVTADDADLYVYGDLRVNGTSATGKIDNGTANPSVTKGIVYTNSLSKVQPYVTNYSEGTCVILMDTSNMTVSTGQQFMDAVQSGMSFELGTNFLILTSVDISGITITTGNYQIVVGGDANATVYSGYVVIGERTSDRGSLSLDNVTINSGNSADVKITVNDLSSISIVESRIFAVVSVSDRASETISIEASSGVNTPSGIMVGYGMDYTLEGNVSSNLDVYGNLIIESDVTVPVGSDLTVYNGGNLTVNGSITIAGAADFKDGSTTVVNGTVNLTNNNGGAAITVGQSTGADFTIAANGVININGVSAGVASTNTLDINNNDATYDANGWSPRFLVEGTLNVNGTLQGTVHDQGTVAFNGASDGGRIVIYDGITVTVRAVSGTLEITDAGIMDDAVHNRDTRNVSDGNILSLNDVRNVTVTETVETLNYRVGTTSHTDYVCNMYVSGTVTTYSSGSTATGTIGTTTPASAIEPVGEEGDERSAAVYISDAVTLGEGVSFIIDSGTELVISGELNALTDRSSVNNYGTVTVTGTFTVLNSDTSGEGYSSTGGRTNAVMYEVTPTNVSEDATVTYTGFVAAIAAASNADNDTVTILGTVTADKNVDIPTGITVQMSAGSQLHVAGGVTVTLIDGAVMNGLSATVEVEGTFTAQDYTDLSVQAVNADVVTTDGNSRTWTSLSNALAAGMTDITLNRPVEITSDTTIPAGTTVTTNIAPGADNYTIRIDGAALTVDGTLAMGERTNGAIVLTDDEDSELEVGGVLSIRIMADDYDNEDVNALAGAHFGIIDGAFTTFYVSNVEFAAETTSNNMNVLGNEVIIRGIVSAGDVEFVASENGLTVNVVKQGDAADQVTILSVTSVALDGATLTIDDNSRVTGTITAPYGDGTSDASMGLSNVRNITIASEKETTASYLRISGTYVGSIDITAGTVTVDADSDLTIGSNATMTVGAGAELSIPNGAVITVDANSNETVENPLVIDGTMTVRNSTGIAGAGEVLINGTMDVRDITVSTTVRVTGTISVENGYTLTIGINGKVILGEKPETLGQTGSGEITGTVSIYAGSNGVIVAYTGADLSGAALMINAATGESEAVSTTYHINGTEYMTVYAYDGEYSVGEADGIDGNINLQGYDTSETWYSTEAHSATDSSANGATLGLYADVYADFAASPVYGIISVGNGLTMYIDDLTINNYQHALGEYNFRLNVGTHTVTVVADSGYNADNATITFNGQTVQNGGTITVTADMDTFTLSASGAVAENPSYTIEGGNNGGSDSLGLTDYLLIILVILIVIMAIMVAFRLMRS